MILGAKFHQIGKPIYMVSYSARLPNLEYNAGRDLESDISTLLREALSCQSKSAAVYFFAGCIS